MTELITYTQSSVLQLAAAFAAGAGLGLFFFGGLRLTIEWLKSAGNPLLLAMMSYAIRLAVAVAGFVWVGKDQWERYVVALMGFLAIRLILARILGPVRYEPTAE